MAFTVNMGRALAHIDVIHLLHWTHTVLSDEDFFLKNIYARVIVHGLVVNYDGSGQKCTAPSVAVRAPFEAGGSIVVPDLVGHQRLASGRIFGSSCSTETSSVPTAMPDHRCHGRTWDGAGCSPTISAVAFAAAEELSLLQIIDYWMAAVHEFTRCFNQIPIGNVWFLLYGSGTAVSSSAVSTFGSRQRGLRASSRWCCCGAVRVPKKSTSPEAATWLEYR